MEFGYFNLYAAGTIYNMLTDKNNLNLLTAITSLLAIVISILSFIHACRSSRRTAIIQIISKERMSWISQMREAFICFEQNYRASNVNGMKDARAKLESLMRRDTAEYCYFLEHVDRCIKNPYSASDYDLLVGLASYMLTRAWQRVKLDGEGVLPRTNGRKNVVVTRRTNLLGSLAASKEYMIPAYVREFSDYYLERRKDRRHYSKLIQDRSKYL